jgi:hypothetical protein
MIAEQIYAGMEMQQGKYNALADNLIGLGRNIVGSLQMQAAQKQVQQALPLMQSAYSQAMDKIQAGQVTEGYRDILNAKLQFGSSQNPFIAQMNQMAGSVAEQAASNYMKTKLYEMQYGPRPTTTTTGLPVVSGAEEAMARMRGEQPAVMAQPTGQPTATMLPPGTPTDAEPIEGAMPEGEVGEAESLMLTEGEVAPMQQPTAVQKTASTAFQQVMDATPSEQDRATRGILASESDKATTWDIERIDNLSRFYPKLNISDSLAIAPVGSKVEYSETWSGQTDKPGARFAGTRKVEVDDEMNKTAKQYAVNLRNSVNLLTTSGPADSDKYWIDIIEEAGGIENVKPVRNPDDNTVSIKPRGKDLINVGIGDEANKIFNAISEVKGLSGFAQASGAKLLPENISGPGVRERKFGSVEEALASGLPAGSTVYILKDGKYKPARIKE